MPRNSGIDTPPNIINHIVLVLDASDSMSGLSSQLISVADAQIAYLAQRSKELDQETRITVYMFSEWIKCIFYDKDVLRLPSLRDHYYTDGMTALVDATARAVDDLKKTPELYGDHAFLIYVLTDGQENASRTTTYQLSQKLQGLADNWTVAVMVPNQNGVYEAKKFGFPANNIEVWDATSKRGVTEAGEVIRRSTDNFMQGRATGVRGSRNLFQMNVAELDKKTVATSLKKLHPGQYRMFPVVEKIAISKHVEQMTGVKYVLGSAYYQLSKTEAVQPQKSIAIFDKNDYSVYIGDDARKLLGLPSHEVKVSPEHNPQFEIFVQSTSTNRNLVPGTNLLLL